MSNVLSGAAIVIMTSLTLTGLGMGFAFFALWRHERQEHTKTRFEVDGALNAYGVARDDLKELIKELTATKFRSEASR